MSFSASSGACIRTFSMHQQADLSNSIFFCFLQPTSTTPQLSRYPALKKFEQTVPIPKAYAALGAFGIFTLVSTTTEFDGARIGSLKLLRRSLISSSRSSLSSGCRDAIAANMAA